jgi:hypothetical protein
MRSSISGTDVRSIYTTNEALGQLQMESALLYISYLYAIHTDARIDVCMYEYVCACREWIRKCRNVQARNSARMRTD